MVYLRAQLKDMTTLSFHRMEVPILGQMKDPLTMRDLGWVQMLISIPDKYRMWD